MVPEVLKEKPSTGTVKLCPLLVEPIVTGRLSKVTMPADAEVVSTSVEIKVFMGSSIIP
jgi:hypothetical protein